MSDSVVQDGFMSKRPRKRRRQEGTENRGTVLSSEEHRRFDEISDDMGFRSGHQVRQFALRWFLREYEAGRIIIPVEEETTIKPKMPGAEEVTS